ncbi:pyridoxal phosphate-dependent aminotransferase [Cyclobacterium plantarum]|uniref:Histidinol-phosphate aminotransferase family protein n=1 Tax=Cyclobacterium plantarum TaxID=2716263 RepID=A0ABX0H8Q8_9BACT|nr:histidinol-phosphate transaminase [Cyclobacterium plantarum]NHE56734.1 histidinol-phosphate aminotransferase family protein [Cyclobacterium plantarum]
MTKLNRRNWLKSSLTMAAGLMSMGYAGAASGSAASLAPSYLPKKDRYARLTSNENPFGPSPSAKKALKAAIDDSFLYPREYRQTLIELIAKEEGVSEDHILLGAGSSELLHAAARVYGGAKGKVLSADPTYTSLIRSAEMMGSEWIKIPLDKNFDHDLSTMEYKVKPGVSLVYLVNPNNPTGKIMTGEEIIGFCNTVSSKVPVFVDEAYWDYMENPKGSTTTACIKEGANVIVARTFSKVHAFAGLRVGYCIAQPEVIKELAKEGPRNTLSGPSMSAATASLVDYDFIKYSVKMNNEGKKFVYDVLEKTGHDYFPSHTNFILFPIAMDYADFKKKMLDNGVGIKSMNVGGQDYCRVSMGKMEDLEMFAGAFQKVIGTTINKS